MNVFAAVVETVAVPEVTSFGSDTFVSNGAHVRADNRKRSGCDVGRAASERQTDRHTRQGRRRDGIILCQIVAAAGMTAAGPLGPCQAQPAIIRYATQHGAVRRCPDNDDDVAAGRCHRRQID